MAGHTKGPWRTRSMGPWSLDSDLGGHSSWAIGNGGGVIAIVVTHEHHDDPEFSANARLIAAAPDLLAAAMMLASLDDGKGRTFPTPEQCAFARAAIAAATGDAK